MGVLVHIGNASEMDWIGHHVMMKRRSQRGDGDGEGPTDGAKCSAVSIQRAPVPSVPLLAWPAQWATKGSRAVNALHELLSSPPGGGTNRTAPIWGALGASMLGLLSVTF